MKQFNVAVACVSLAIFAAACSDSAVVPSSPLSPTHAAFAGNPPPPPLTGDFGEGFLSPFDEESEAAVASAASANSAPTNGTCGSLAGQSITYSWSYLNNKPDNDQWAHLDLDNQNRNVSIHQTDNKFDATGEIVGPNYVFKITGVLSGFLDPSGFDLTVTGVVTLSDGSKCTATADLSGSLAGESTPGN